MTPKNARSRSIGAAVIALSATVMFSPEASAASAHSAARSKCCRVAAGTPVQVELVDQLSTAVQKPGDTFALRLAAPLIVDGMVVLPKGARGVGEVVDSKGPGIGGKPGEIVLAAKSVSAGGRQVPLNAMHLARPGEDRSRTSQAVGLGGLAFAPLKFVGIVVPGGNVELHPGTVASAKVASAVTLPPLRRASRADLAAASAVAATAAPTVAGPIAIAPPPPGHGQVVFFRPKSVMGTGQWFNVRENGKALGKLSNGAYFVEVTPPGIHVYSAKLEPELKDHLTLQVDAGETYFVEGALTGGLLLGAANLSPSTRNQFEKSAKDLKPAEAPANAERHAEGSRNRAASEAPASP